MRAILSIFAATLPSLASADVAHVTAAGDLRCIVSDGLPDHATGRFPNRGNPHRVSSQSIKFCVDATPSYSGKAREVQTVGIATNGVIIRPGTADWYDPRSRRGFSRNDASGWQLDGKGAGTMLGLDQESAHVDHRGLYHYHAVGPALSSEPGTLVGWAADGFEIHYAGDQAKSSYRLKSGTRASGPGGAHDGTYVQDWQYVNGAGNLDECNGAMVNGTYTYFATNTFPYFPHCLKGAQIMRFR